jgi:hypothetical protein
MKTNVVPNMAFRPYSLPPTMQQLGYTMKLGDEKRSGCERDWETTYDETINLTVRQPSAKKSALSASKLPFYSTGFVLTDTQVLPLPPFFVMLITGNSPYQATVIRRGCFWYPTPDVLYALAYRISATCRREV